jgi:MFS family permease
MIWNTLVELTSDFVLLRMFISPPVYQPTTSRIHQQTCFGFRHLPSKMKSNLPLASTEEPEQSLRYSSTIPHVCEEKDDPSKTQSEWKNSIHILFGHFGCFNTWGMVNSFGIFQQYYTNTFHWSPSATSWIGSMQIFLLFAVGVFVGRAVDAGYYRLTLYLGICFQLLGIFAASAATEYWQFLLAQGVSVGLGHGFIFVPAITAVSSYFRQWRTLAVGLASAGAAVGGLIYPAIASQLLYSVGLGWTLRVMGFVVLATYIPSLIWARTAFPPRESGPLVEWAAFKEITYTLGLMSFFLIYWAISFAFFYAGRFAQDKLTASREDSLHLLMVINGCGVIGRIFPSLLADIKFGLLNVMTCFTLLSSIALYSWQCVKSFETMYIFAVFYGLFAGALQSLLSALAPCLTTDVRKLGTRMGMMMTIVGFSALTGTPIAGALIEEAEGSYMFAQNFTASAMMAAAICIAGARIFKTGWKLAAKA